MKANENTLVPANLNHLFIKIYKNPQGPYDQFIHVLNLRVVMTTFSKRRKDN